MQNANSCCNLLGLRQAGACKLYYNLCTWINISSSNRIWRKYKGLKIIAHVCSWDKLWTRCKKRPKPNHHFCGARSKSRIPCMIPAHITTKKADRSPKSPIQANLLICPTLIPFKEPAIAPPHHHEGPSKGTYYLFLLPLAAAQVPLKPCLSSFSVLILIVID